MNKVSRKLAASVRKVKTQEGSPDTAVQSAARETATHSMEKKFKSSSLEPKHPKRVWPD